MDFFKFLITFNFYQTDSELEQKKKLYFKPFATGL